MFVLKTNPTVVWPVDIGMPVDGGKLQNIPVNINYKLIPQEEYDRLKVSDFDLLREVVVGWGDEDFGAQSEDGKTQDVMPYSPENLNRLIAFPYVRSGLIAGFWEAQAGIEKN
ncbi:MAG: hypothetical protein ACTH5B_03445 [Marinomonas sp.]|uniref:hypothetical protein n=1 Tax=Marinomonas sp. TaxID=1904862 RepID=UPI003F9E97CE